MLGEALGTAVVGPALGYTLGAALAMHIHVLIEILELLLPQ